MELNIITGLIAAGSTLAGVAPRLGHDATGLGWVYEYILKSDCHNLAELRSLQDWYLRYELQTVPGVAEVANAFPNPFNGNTTIAYEIPEKSFVTLALYYLSGREITTLIKKTQNAGSYSVSWDAADLPSGIYYCRMEAGEYKHSIKLALIR